MSNDVKKWTANQHKFIAWLSLPAVEREPLFQHALATEMRVAEETLSRWKKLPGFEEAVQEIIKANLGDALADVMGAFKDQAKRGEFQHIRLYFEMMGMYVPKMAPTTPDGKRPYGALTDDELQRIIQQELASYVAQTGGGPGGEGGASG